MNTADALALIRLWAHCRCSPCRAPTDPCRCPDDRSLEAVYRYARGLECLRDVGTPPAAYLVDSGLSCEA